MVMKPRKIDLHNIIRKNKSFIGSIFIVFILASYEYGVKVAGLGIVLLICISSLAICSILIYLDLKRRFHKYLRQLVINFSGVVLSSVIITLYPLEIRKYAFIFSGFLVMIFISISFFRKLK